LYISLHVFVPSHLELFTDVVKEGCYIFTHHIPLNIIYNIKLDKVEIDGNFLRLALVGDEKNIISIILDVKILLKKW